MRFGKLFGKSQEPVTLSPHAELAARLEALPSALSAPDLCLERMAEVLDDLSTQSLPLTDTLTQAVAVAAAAQPAAERLLDEFLDPASARQGSFALIDRLAAHHGAQAGLYAALFQRMQAESAVTAPVLASAAQGYLQAWGAQRRVARLRQRPLGRLSWQQAHVVLTILQRCGLFPAGGEASGDARACLRAYQQVAYEETMPWGNLTPAQQALAMRLIAEQPSLPWGLCRETESTHGLDLAAADGPRRLGATAAPVPSAPGGDASRGPFATSQRYLSTCALSARASELLACSEAAWPDGLHAVRLDAQSRVQALRLLASHWSATPPQRENTRHAVAHALLGAFGFATVRQLVDISSTLGRTKDPNATVARLLAQRQYVSEISRDYHLLSYGDVAPATKGVPEKTLQAVQDTQAELHTREARLGASLERWVETDASGHGIGVRVPAMLQRHAVGTLVAWRAEAGLRWHVGVIRRDGRDASDRPTLGIEALAEPAVPVVLQRIDSAHPGARDADFILGLALGPQGDSVVLPAGTWAAAGAVGVDPAISVRLFSDAGERAVRLLRVIERGADWERVALEHAGPT